MAQSRKFALAAKPALRLIVAKPEPDNLLKDQEILDRILAEGFSFTRQLCRDSVGAERPTITVRMNAEIARGHDRMELHAFISRRLGGKTLVGIGTHSELLCDILSDAEDAGIVRLRESKE